MIPWLILIPALVLSAQRTALNEAGISSEGVEITLKGLSPEALRPGTFQFSWKSVASSSVSSPSAVVLWRGERIEEDGKRVAIWARVQMTRQRSGVVAARSIPLGRPITAADLRSSTWTTSVFQNETAVKPDELIGATLKRSIPAGTPLLQQMVAGQNQVQPGDSVRIESIAGGARIAFDAVAENRANPGERVYFRNPLNGRRVSGVSDAGHRVVFHSEISR